ncbi:MAG TPA: M15 family metallopeptidase [Mycobacterium sp.]|nr:M15 family metallopeptidase [Mycobacterium sp.]
MSVESVQLRIAAISQFAGVRRPPAPSRGASFDAALQDAIATSDRSSSLSSSGAPSELARFGNGKVPASALEPVGRTGHRMWAPAARALTRLIDDAAAQGVTIGVTDSYRSFDAQLRVAQEKGLYRSGGLAATPGTSNHGWGRSADLDLSPRALAWMREHASEYGFEADVARESWHWTYTPTT